MELLPGGDLFSQVVQRWCSDKATGYSESDVREILRMALSGLDALHAMRIVHRDIKPENLLLLDRRGGLLDLRIADLGTARQLGATEKCSSRAGTPGYMAPEILLELPYGLPVDVWSLGVILYTLLSGRHPFDAADDEKQESYVKGGRWNFAHPNWHGVSNQAKEVVSSLLCVSPHSRPTVGQLLVHPWVRSSVVSEHSPTRPPGSRASGKDGASLARVGSLPGSKSLLELQGLNVSGRLRRASGEQSGSSAMLSSGPPSAPTKMARSAFPSEGGIEVDQTPSTRDWRLLFGGTNPRAGDTDGGHRSGNSQL